MAQTINAGTEQHAAAGAEGAVHASLALVLDEPADSPAEWEIEIHVEARRDGRALLGVIRTLPPAGTNPPSRVVALASCPGAEVWHVVARCLNSRDPAIKAQVRMLLSPEPLGCCAIQPLNGSVDASTAPEEEEP